MIDLELVDNDLPVTRPASYISGEMLTVQRINSALSLFFGEYYLAVDRGLDWPGFLQLKGEPGDQVLGALLDAILAVEGVANAEGEVTFATRELTASIRVTLDTGTVVVAATANDAQLYDNWMPFSFFFVSGVPHG